MCFNDIPVEHMRIFHQIVRLVRNDRVVDQRCECGDVIRFMNLHVQQSVHVLAAQTYCQIAVSGGGAVKGVRHLKKMIRFIESPNGRSQRPSSAKLPLAMRETIFPPIFESRPYVLPWWKRNVQHVAP